MFGRVVERRSAGLDVTGSAADKMAPRACFKHQPSFSFFSRLYRRARKGPYGLRSVSQQCPLGCPRNSANVCLVEHRSFPTSEGGMSADSFLFSSFLQAINAVMICSKQEVSQASKHLCPAKLQTRYDVCCDCQSQATAHFVRVLFIGTTSA